MYHLPRILDQKTCPASYISRTPLQRDFQTPWRLFHPRQMSVQTVHRSHSVCVSVAVLKVGLIASSTPFITGRPVTLFHNDKIYSSGAVGVALTGLQKDTPRPRIDFPELMAISEGLTITR